MHVKALLQSRREKAIEEYTKLLNSLRHNGAVSGRFVNNDGGIGTTPDPTYLCLQCTNISDSRARHRANHIFCASRNLPRLLRFAY